MPNKLGENRQRVSIAEDIEIVEQLKAIAVAEGKTLTDVYAEAARKLINKKLKKDNEGKK